MDHAVKFVEGHDDMIEGMLAPFGGTDLMGEHFTADTNFELEWFGAGERPLLYAHGTDPAIKTSVIGRMSLSQTDKGVWMQAQLDKSHAYKDAVSALIKEGVLGLSAGSIERFYLPNRNPQTGAIKHFPIIEGSLTTGPAHPEALLAPYAAKSVDALEHLSVLGVKAPAQLDEPEDKGIEDEHLPVIEPATKDHIWDAIKSVLSPQSLHDAAVASGAACAPSETHEPPASVLAVAGNGAAKSVPIDLEAFRAELTALAVETVKQELRK